MKIVDYVSKYLKESYDEPKGIENEEDAKKAIEDLKDFFEMGEDEENEFGDDLDKMLMAMDSGEEVDDLDLDDLDLDFDEAKNDMEEATFEYDCEQCADTPKGKYCMDCGAKNEISDEDEEIEERENREDEGDRNFPDERSKKRDYDEGDSFSDMVKRSGHSDGYDDDDDDEYDEDGIPKYPDPMQGRTRPGQRRLYSSKNYNMTEMEKKLEAYREGKKNKKGFKPRGVVDAGDSSDGE